LISYAQNFEDVLLWRSLKDVKNGFYVDVGAGDPVNDSVTKWFYDQGWSGINIEPNDEDFEALSKDRTQDINLKVAVGPHQGVAQFYLNQTKGWSTMDAKTAKAAQALGSQSEIINVKSMPLRNILEHEAPKVIHFMKIDVEGYEDQALESADFQKYRPWIVVVEFADLRGKHGDPNNAFPILKKSRYNMSFFDGLNLYFVSEEKKDLGESFKTPACVFDNFTLFRHQQLEQQTQKDKQKIEMLEPLVFHFSNSENDREARGKVIEEQGAEIKNLKEAASSAEKIICRCQELFEKLRIVYIVANPLVYGFSKSLIRSLAKYLEEARSHLRASRNN
jgi:FkbM family methyltransferase